jgi:pimeloyl-ACP methyl ester carboxylesterase
VRVRTSPYPRGTVAIRERRFELAGYLTRALELEGSSSEPALILMHGWSDSADCWRPLLRELERSGRRAVALDMPGFGEASRLDRERAVLPQLDRFVAAAVRTETEPGGEAVLCGNSLGGCVALRAAERPELAIAGIVPVAPAGLDMAQWFNIIETTPIVRALLRAPVPLPDPVVRGAVGRVYRSVAFARPSAVDPAAVASFTRHVPGRRDVVRLLATGRRLRAELEEGCFRLGRIGCPVLVVWGDSDRMVYSSGAERILREVPDARLEVIPASGHCPQVECPAELAALLDGFPPAPDRTAAAKVAADAEGL